jgi:hypothetical protein
MILYESESQDKSSCLSCAPAFTCLTVVIYLLLSLACDRSLLLCYSLVVLILLVIN